MNTEYQPPDENEVFNTFHDMVHAAILGSRTGQATLKEIYAACVRFGRVKCRRTGGWRLVTERRNWKSHVRHTLYTTEKFLRCPHDSDSWMLAPEFCYQLPATTRQCTGPAPPEDNGDDLPRGGSARGSIRTLPRAHVASLSTYPATLRGGRSLAGSAAPVRQRSAAGRSQRMLAAVAVSDARDTDSNDWEEDELPEDEHQGQEQEDDEEGLGQEDEQEAPQRLQRASRCRIAAGAGEWSDARSAAAQAYGVGSRNGRAQALLGVTAAAAAAEAAVGEDDLDLNGDETRTALRAAQEVLTNPAAARILLRLMRQRDGQQQIREPFQHGGQATAMQDQALPCRSRHWHSAEPETDEDGGEPDADERATSAHGVVGPSSAKGNLVRQLQGEQVLGASGVRHGPLHEGCGQRQAARQYTYPHAHASSRAAPRLAASGGIAGRGDRVLKAFFPGPGDDGSGTAPHSSATGVAGHVGSAVEIGDRKMGMAGRMEGLGGGGGHGGGWPVARLQAAESSDEVWREGGAAEHGSWPDKSLNVDEEEWEAEEGLEDARHYGTAGAWPVHAAGTQRGRRQGGKKAAPSGAKATSGLQAFGRRGESPHWGWAARHPQQLQYMPQTHFNAATAAAAAAAAVAAAAAAGEAPLRLAGRGQVLGKRGWLESKGGSDFDADSAGEGAEELHAYQHQQQHQPGMQSANYPPPFVLRRLAEELQAYQSRSAAAAAAAAAAAVASAANMQQPLGYHGQLLC